MGEHTVLRGHPAMVFPVPDKLFTLSYEATQNPLKVMATGEHGADMKVVFEHVLAHGMQRLQQSMSLLTGTFYLENQIPLGVGMGASAALSVAVTRWFAAQFSVENEAMFARELEHLFHGTSSGLDIAGVSSSSGVLFHQGVVTPLEPAWDPVWQLSYSGHVGLTAESIQRVQALWARDAEAAKALDDTMHACVQQAKAALTTKTSSSCADLAAAMNRAATCFVAWDLVTEGMATHMQSLREAGALAVKPTGSGLGGFVVSLYGERLC